MTNPLSSFKGGWQEALEKIQVFGSFATPSVQARAPAKRKKRKHAQPLSAFWDLEDDHEYGNELEDFTFNPDNYEDDDECAPDDFFDHATFLQTDSEFITPGLQDAPFLRKGSTYLSELQSQYEQEPLCEGSKMCIVDFIRIMAALRYKHSDTIGDTVLSSFVGIVAACLPPDNMIQALLGNKPSIYRAVGPLNLGLYHISTVKACVTVHICRNGCMAFCGARSESLTCSKCDCRRYHPCRKCQRHDCTCLVKKRPIEVAYFFPLAYRIKKTLQSWLRPFLNYPSRRYKPFSHNNYYSDVYDGDTWKWFESQMRPREHFIGIAMCSDGMDMFNKSGKSTNPVQVSVLNFPPCMRSVLHVGLFLWAIDKGTDGALQVICEELKHLWEVGIEFDGITHRIGLVSVVLDGRGLEKVKKQQGNGSYAGCTDCAMDGLRFNDAMCIYGHRR